ncbi:MAG: 30S ribosomal protein S16 [Candidatus Hydrogenedentota bacterium]
MSVKVRLKRVGAKKRPMYRIVVADSRAPRDGKNIETIGHFNPMVQPPELKINEDRLADWVKRGAQMTPTVKGLLSRTRRSSAGREAAPATVAARAKAPASEASA